MDETKRRLLIDRIVKLFALGDTSRNNSEEETLLAITKARRLMTEHNISVADVARATPSMTERQIHVLIVEHMAYTLKGNFFASYDDITACAVDLICHTQNVIYKSRQFHDRTLTNTISRAFVGEEADVAVASELFMILLSLVRKRARDVCGRGGRGWSNAHTSYADGFSMRLYHRAKEQVTGLTPEQEKSVALVLASKQLALKDYMNRFKEGKQRRQNHRDPVAWSRGYRDGADVSLQKGHTLTGESQ